MTLASVDTLSLLIAKDKTAINQGMLEIITLAQGVLRVISNGVSVLHERDQKMFGILEPLFADKNRTHYEARATFLRQLAPDQTGIIDEATDRALSFCDYIDNQTDEGRAYLEMQQTTYAQALSYEIDGTVFRVSTAASSLYGLAELATARIDNLHSLMTNAVFTTLMQMPIRKIEKCGRITGEH